MRLETSGADFNDVSSLVKTQSRKKFSYLLFCNRKFILVDTKHLNRVKKDPEKFWPRTSGFFIYSEKKIKSGGQAHGDPVGYHPIFCTIR